MQISKKSRTVALILVLLLGIVGGHRFYVGKVGTGILMLALAITGISALWAFIDLIVIAIGKFKDKQGKVLTNW